MPRSESKRTAFARLLATGLPPLEAAKRAGYAQPQRFVGSLTTTAQERGLTDQLDDRALALRALRNATSFGEGNTQVAAAKALLDHSAPAGHESSDARAIVTFHGRTGDTDLDELLERTDPDLVRRAVALLRTADADAIDAYATEHAITAEQISSALAKHTAPCPNCAGAQAPVAPPPMATCVAQQQPRSARLICRCEFCSAPQPEPLPDLPAMAPPVSMRQPTLADAPPTGDLARGASLIWGN